MNIKILVVDDEVTIRDSLREVLQMEGYQVDVADSGDTAIEIIKQKNYDMVLLDIRMPGMTGIEVLRVIGQNTPDTKVILLTAHGTLETAMEALRYGAHDYILKPATSRNILASVARGLAQKAEKQQKKILLEQLENSIRRLKDAEGIDHSTEQEPQTLALDNGVIFDLDRREVWQGDQKVSLTPTEAKLLKVLVENRARVITHRELVFLVQGYDVNDWEAPEVLRPLISRLRRKLSFYPEAENWIINVRGTGYLFDPTKPSNSIAG